MVTRHQDVEIRWSDEMRARAMLLHNHQVLSFSTTSSGIIMMTLLNLLLLYNPLLGSNANRKRSSNGSLMTSAMAVRLILFLMVIDIQLNSIRAISMYENCGRENFGSFFCIGFKDNRSSFDSYDPDHHMTSNYSDHGTCFRDLDCQLIIRIERVDKSRFIWTIAARYKENISYPWAEVTVNNKQMDMVPGWTDPKTWTVYNTYFPVGVPFMQKRNTGKYHTRVFTTKRNTVIHETNTFTRSSNMTLDKDGISGQDFIVVNYETKETGIIQMENVDTGKLTTTWAINLNHDVLFFTVNHWSMNDNIDDNGNSTLLTVLSNVGFNGKPISIWTERPWDPVTMTPSLEKHLLLPFILNMVGFLALGAVFIIVRTIGSCNKKSDTEFTFNDLSEDVQYEVTKYLPLEERAAFTRTSRMMGEFCNSLWITQKKLPREFYLGILLAKDRETKKYYYAAVLNIPNLTKFVVAEKFVGITVSFEQLATKCPRIQSFNGPLALLVSYLKVLKDENCIKSIHLSGMENVHEWNLHQNDSAFRDGMKVLADYLIHLNSMTIESYENLGFPMNIPHLKILGQRVSRINLMFETYEEMYQHFEPGDKLEELIEGQCSPQPLPTVIAARHPKLKKIGELNVMPHHLRILNQILYLKSVALCFNHDEESGTDEVMVLFRSFLSGHIHLKRLKIFENTKNRLHNEVVQAICQLRPGLKYLDLQIWQFLHVNEHNFLDHLHQLTDLRGFEFKGNTTIQGWNINPFMPLFASWPKIRRVCLNPFQELKRKREIKKYYRIVAESEKRIKEFTEVHHRGFIFHFENYYIELLD